MMRAILLARATVTSIFGLRANICASHEPLGAPRRLGCRTTALAPMINRRRIVRSPRFETAPSFCLPPVDFCSGVSPSQAAKSRPAGNPSAAGTNAVIAVEAIGPTPGIVINRRAVGSDFERWLISVSNAAICAPNAVDGAHTVGERGLWVLDQNDQ